MQFQEQTGSRIAWIDRLGEGIIPTRESVLQEGDMVHMVLREEHAERVYSAYEKGPED